MTAKFRADRAGDRVKVSIVFEGEDPSPLAYLDPNEARTFAQYLNAYADQAERSKVQQEVKEPG